eukprot:COSAG05_NODE_17836_length_318_cov_1.136986_1_plen_48_part_10
MLLHAHAYVTTRTRLEQQRQLRQVPAEVQQSAETAHRALPRVEHVDRV